MTSALTRCNWRQEEVNPFGGTHDAGGDEVSLPMGTQRARFSYLEWEALQPPPETRVVEETSRERLHTGPHG